jgi:hypothetical protein
VINVHIIDTSGQIIKTTVQSSRRLIYSGAQVLDVAMEGRKCMDVIHLACSTMTVQYADYLSTDGRVYLGAVVPINRGLVVVYETVMSGGNMRAARERIQRFVGRFFPAK